VSLLVDRRVVEAQESKASGVFKLLFPIVGTAMPGGEGLAATAEPSNRVTSEYSPTASASRGDEYAGTHVEEASAALASDGLRRRKVIYAAKETLDKGEFEARSIS
jgi:hypothetical protein